MHVYKILRADEWHELRHYGLSAGSPVDKADGFVHLSTGEQVAGTAARHFAAEDDLMLLALDADKLGNRLRWETSRDGALFPHLYRSLRMSDILWHKPLPLGPDGHDFPDEVE